MKHDDDTSNDASDRRQLGLFDVAKKPPARARARARALGLDDLPIRSNGVETSDEAAESLKPDAGRLRLLVLENIIEAGSRGRTCDEIEQLTELPHQTASARVYDLHRAKRIVDSGTRRETRSGRKAIVWTVASSAAVANPTSGPAPSSAPDRT
jgi:hypothetical protein